MQAVDTNVLLRLILNDDAEQYRRAKELVVRVSHAGEKLYIPQIVIQELVWVLLNKLGIPRQDLVVALDGLLAMPVWEIEESGRIARAIQIFEQYPVDFTDACLGAISHERGIESVLSFDRDMGKIGARWIRP
jgi:predicted nucleic-acid-binding protein